MAITSELLSEVIKLPQNVKEKMTKALEIMEKNFSSIRTGRANPEILDRITVEYYGTNVPLKQVASISVPDPKMIALQVFDKNAVIEVEKAILKSDLGINPQVDGTVVRLRFPDLTEERRKELIKMIKKMAEDSKVSIRNIRRDAIEHIKKEEKDISEDDMKKHQDEVQKVTDNFMKEIDQLLSKKEEELMKI